MTWNQLGYHAKPCGLLDVNGYYALSPEIRTTG
ncbi:LOG family protein [Pseudodesulfovibrio profundus]|nr:LOG family protein [Pseudodesulfovibrio profundus]